MAIQSDGKIVVAEPYNNGSDLDFAVARYNSDGSLDTSFDGDGKVTTDIDSGDAALAMVIQSDGKILLAGYGGGYKYFALARYNSDGSLDNTFGTGGKVTTDIGGSYDLVYDIAIQSDGKIIVTGDSYNGNYDFALARYTSNGSLDLSFDGDGKVTTPIGGGNDYAYDIAIQSDGKIVVAGYSDNGSNDDFALVCYWP